MGIPIIAMMYKIHVVLYNFLLERFSNDPDDREHRVYIRFNIIMRDIIIRWLYTDHRG